MFLSPCYVKGINIIGTGFNQGRLMKKFADYVIEKRLMVLGIFSVITLFFLINITGVKVYTKFADLLPQGHEYIKTYNSLRARFGGANTMTMLLQVRNGDIFNPATLQKIRDITDELYYIPGVDRFKITSLAVNTAVDMQLTSGGYNFVPLMFPNVPKTQEEAEELRQTVYPSVFYGNLVWFDSKKTLISADFFDDEIDYQVVFKELRRIQEKYEDANHILSINGEPMHLGYIDFYKGDVFRIILITIVIMFLPFYFWYRSVRAAAIPFFAAAVSGIWGIGTMCFLDYNLDPLIMVFPFLVASRAACHTVQLLKRYTEECVNFRDGKAACKKVIESMFVPGFTAIITDAMGIILIALTPIQILQKITYVCTFWSCAQCAIVLILVPVVLSYLPISPRLLEKFDRKGVIDRMLARLGAAMGGRGSLVVFAMVPLLVIFGYLGSRSLQVGDAAPGSSLLWPWHRYNRDGFRISFSMPILSPLLISMEGEKQYDLVSCPGKPYQMCGDNFKEMERFERYMKGTPGRLVMFTRSVISSFSGAGWLAHEGDPNWYFFPTNDRETIYSYRRITQMGTPGTADRFCDPGEDTSANIIIYCRDKMTPTIKTVMARINEYMEQHSQLAPPMRYRLCGGDFGVQAAINEVIEQYNFRTSASALIIMFLTCWVMFRSLGAAIFLTIPCIVSNLIAYTMMATGMFYLLPVPLTINLSTLPVAAIGIGLGIDYGIYMLGRIVEEYKIRKDMKETITFTMTCVGEPIILTSLGMIGGLIVWVASPLMFQATMGFFLAVILFLNMLGGLLLVTSFVAVLKPKFVVGKK